MSKLSSISKSPSLWLIAIVGGGISVGAFYFVQDWERNQLQIEFERQAHLRIRSIDHALAHRKNILCAVRAFFCFNHFPDRRTFQAFAGQMLAHESVISALAFIPSVVHRRPGFSTKAPRWHDQVGPPLIDRAANGNWIPSGERAEYHPVWFVEPSSHVELPPGWDVGSDPAMKAALERARDSGKMAAAISTAPGETGSQQVTAEVYLCAPMFQDPAVPERIEDRRLRLVGFICGVFNLDKLVQHAVRDLPRSDFILRIHDASSFKSRLIFSNEPSRQAANSRLSAVQQAASTFSCAQTIKLSDRQWRIEYTAPPDWENFSCRKSPWAALVGCLLLTALLTGHLIQKHLAEQDRLLYQRKLQTLALQLSAAEEQERRRIAANLHDRVSQGLAVAMMKLTLLGKSAHGPAISDEIHGLERALGQALDDSRSLTSELSPTVLYELGLEPAIEWAASQMRKRFDLETLVQWDGRARPLDERIRGVLFQATSELLTNVVKHAGVRTATVSIKRDERNIHISVEDKGVGFNGSTLKSTYENRDEFGLFNIRERLRHLGGCLRIESTPGRGVRATLIAPLKPDDPQTSRRGPA